MSQLGPGAVPVSLDVTDEVYLEGPINQTGAMLCTKHAARHTRAVRAGRNINIASIYGLLGSSRGLQVVYAVARHALIGLTPVDAADFRRRNDPLDPPAGRWGETADLIGAARFPAVPASGFVSGAIDPVDGGYLASDGAERS